MTDSAMTGGLPAPRTETVEVDGRRLTVARWGTGPARLVLLHDGLGSIAQWRDVPARLAERTGAGVVAYDRAGHGRSTPTPTGPWPANWLERESVVLVRLLAALRIERPVLVGHSDGASIALLRAADACADPPSLDEFAPAGVVALAPHSFVEQRCVDAIATLRADRAPVVARLARHHAAPADLFEAWSGVWTSAAFRDWDMRARLGTVCCPVHVMQGDEDEYATDVQLTSTVVAIGDRAAGERVPGRGHLLHHEAPDVVVDAVLGLRARLQTT